MKDNLPTYNECIKLRNMEKVKHKKKQIHPFRYVVLKDTIKTRDLGKHVGYCECGLFYGTKEIGEPCGRCGRIYPDPNWEDGYDEWRSKRGE